MADIPINEVLATGPAGAMPRPVETVAPFPKKAAQNRVRDLLSLRHGHHAQGGESIARASVDPGEDRSRLNAAEPKRIAGGWLVVAHLQLSPLAIGLDVTNVRNYHLRHYPTSGAEYGSGPREIAFPPPPPFESSTTSPNEVGLQMQSPEHLAWALQGARDELKHINRTKRHEIDFAQSIAEQGVLEEITCVPVTVEFQDGSEPITVLMTIDGNSRLVEVHDLLGISPQDPFFDHVDGRVLRRAARPLHEIDPDAASGIGSRQVARSARSGPRRSSRGAGQPR